MQKYRVALKEEFKGQELTFAIFLEAKGLFEAERNALEEFPNASVIKIEEDIAPDLGGFN